MNGVLERLLEFFCGSKSTRPEAKKLYPFLPVTQADIKERNLDEEPRAPPGNFDS